MSEDGELHSDRTSSGPKQKLVALKVQKMVVQEARVDQLHAELSQVRDEMMRQGGGTHAPPGQPKKKTRGAKKPATAKSPNVGASLAKLMASQRSDNYDVVSMDVESPPKGSAEEEEEEALRRVLLEQVEKKRLQQQKKATTTTSAPPETSKSRPPLSPPQQLLPPPPQPPEKLVQHAMGMISTPVSPPDNSSERFTGVSPSDSALLDEDLTPKSPADLEDNLLEEELGLSDAPDSSPELSDYELDLDEAREDNRARRRELTKLFRQQRKQQEDFSAARKTVERLKDELEDAERKVVYHAEKSMELNERVNSLMERYFTAQAKKLSAVREERDKWKSRVGRAHAHTKEKIVEKLKRVFKGRIQKPKTIPLVEVDAQRPAEKQPQTISKPTESTNSQSAEARTNAQKKAAKAKQKAVKSAVQASAPKPNKSAKPKAASSLAGGRIVLEEDILAGTSSAEAERRLLQKLTAKRRAASTGGQTPPASAAPCPAAPPPSAATSLTSPRSAAASSAAPAPAAPQPSAALAAEPNGIPADPPAAPDLRAYVTQPSAHAPPPSVSLNNPLLRLRSYRLYPQFPFEHIAHPALSGHIDPAKPICPFELHGTCMDQQCEWQHDQDIRVSEEEIVKEMLAYYPPLCPAHLDLGAFARHLLSQAPVDAVARYIAANIPASIREVKFSAELRSFLAG